MYENFYNNEEFCCSCNGYNDGCECDCHGEELENFMDEVAGYESPAEVAFKKIREIESLLEVSREYQNLCLNDRDWDGYWAIQALKDKLLYAHKELSFVAYSD